jgi:Siphovirus Gp157
MNLYKINSEYEQILNELYDDEGQVNQEALMRLDQNDMTMENKVIAVASYIKNLDAEREAIDAAKKAMAEREKAHKKKISDLQGYLLVNMERRGITKVTCPYFEISLKKCPLSVDDDQLNMEVLPDEYKRTKTEVLPDKVKILQEMKVGVIIPGVGLKQDMRLQIK